MKTLFIVITVLYLILYFIFAAMSGNFKKATMLTAVIGIALLISLHITGCYFGFMIPLNIYTFTISALTGLPGVVFISMLDFIFI